MRYTSLTRRGTAVPTYIALLRWTGEGVKNIKDSPSRLDAARKAFQAAGVTMRGFYLVTGRYDMVTINEAPDDVAMAKAVLSVASRGAVQTETLRAFTEDEYRKIVAGLP
jgi:uncharacterized protein with GYD domain